MGAVTNMRTSTTLLLAAFCLALVFAPISLAEDAPPAEEEAMPNPEEDGAKEMGEMDKDKDGKATLEEIKTFMKEKYYTKPEDLKDLENDDGKPATPEDIVKMIDRDATELIDELDKDKSKDLSLEESWHSTRMMPRNPRARRTQKRATKARARAR